MQPTSTMTRPPKKKGLDDSIWASRGKPSNFTTSSSSSSSTYARTRQGPPPTSTIIPAVPQPPSPTKNGHAYAYNSPANSGSSRTASTVATPAASTPTPTPATTSTTLKPAAPSSSAAQREFKRYIQIVRRLKWKLPYLSHGYHHAIARPGDALYAGETNAAEAELMFKLDFYEYYMLLERALIHLLGVFGITVSRDARVGNGTQQHTYHQNVLAALERPGNPLHAALGEGDVLFQLTRAKELRNRWKYAEEVAKTGTGTTRSVVKAGSRDGTAPLESYDLDRMFEHVFRGFDAGYAVAERRVAEETGAGGRLSWADEVEGMEVEEAMEEDVDEDEFGFMVEAMDWEAV
ncbi:hypothetical protein CkaCkLH20_10389 [Colletotrichum karsti]|uniref:Fungal specific transcription factor n=1 Tax=Colletotrichum karsti TaxID=1095194 RepID=A0A9P6HVP9_9PEZI|nr:uncharacterized protein CkaCkLH20_10389 [Colletotrichum karsti]KAF9872052.1 hypothetical protein CkaCkLH20_10389 [Colletotrichum karsti]